MNAIKFPSAQQARDLSTSEKDSEWRLLEMSGLIRASVMAAAEAGERSTRILLPTKLDLLVQNLISKTLRKYGYQVRITTSESFNGRKYTKRTVIYLQW